MYQDLLLVAVILSILGTLAGWVVILASLKTRVDGHDKRFDAEDKRIETVEKMCTDGLSTQIRELGKDLHKKIDDSIAALNIRLDNVISGLSK